MNLINATDIAAASSPGAEINGVTLIYMCTLFGFMKEWLQEGIMSTDSAMIYDTDTTEQRERMFSDADCSEYRKFSIPGRHLDCVNNTMVYETNTKWLKDFTRCITIHFMTELGARSICYNDSVRYDNGTSVKNRMTLLSKDSLLYTFMVDTLNVENICQARNNTVTLSANNCTIYDEFELAKVKHAGSVCAYNTPNTDNNTDLPYYDRLHYRFLTHLGAERFCKEMTLADMCHLFGVIEEWLQKGGISTDDAMVHDTDTLVQKRWVFSDADCDEYKFMGFGECINNSMIYNGFTFTDCITTHFMTVMGARSSCYDDSVRSDSDTNAKSTVTLESKNRLFYTFMVDALDARNICQGRNDTVTIDTDDCYYYIWLVKDLHAESRCAYNTPRTDTGRIDYCSCLQYRFLKSLGADTICQVSLIKNCDWYYDTVQSLAPTCICVLGLIGNLLSLCMFCSDAVDTPTAYQLQWLAGVDTTLILTW